MMLLAVMMTLPNHRQQLLSIHRHPSQMGRFPKVTFKKNQRPMSLGMQEIRRAASGANELPEK
jgi:hypothetical protein